MRKKKLRGHKRRWRIIDHWRKSSLNFEVDYFKEYKRDYKEILISPWCDYNTTNSEYPEPKGKTKLKLLEALLDIAEYWIKELKKNNSKFSVYLWIYDERFSKSQVVCAIEEYIDYYDKTFQVKESSLSNFKLDFPQFEDRFKKFNWTECLDEYFLDLENDLGSIDEYNSQKEFEGQKKWFYNQLKHKHREVEMKNGNKVYALERGTVWIGKLINEANIS